MVKTIKIICHNNVKAFKKISLSQNTVAQRIQELANNISELMANNLW